VTDKILEIGEITVTSNSQDLPPLVEAINAMIRTETLTLANQQGIENPVIPEYKIGELFQKYDYRCRRLRPKWYRHTFTLKTTPVQK
jgi:hypothetical protein